VAVELLNQGIWPYLAASRAQGFGAVSDSVRSREDRAGAQVCSRRGRRRHD
jgi:hypothetical protein